MKEYIKKEINIPDYLYRWLVELCELSGKDMDYVIDFVLRNGISAFEKKVLKK